MSDNLRTVLNTLKYHTIPSIDKVPEWCAAIDALEQEIEQYNNEVVAAVVYKKLYLKTRDELAEVYYKEQQKDKVIDYSKETAHQMMARWEASATAYWNKHGHI